MLCGYQEHGLNGQKLETIAVDSVQPQLIWNKSSFTIQGPIRSRDVFFSTSHVTDSRMLMGFCHDPASAERLYHLSESLMAVLFWIL